jgi:hypothetical protein
MMMSFFLSLHDRAASFNAAHRSTPHRMEMSATRLLQPSGAHPLPHITLDCWEAGGKRLQRPFHPVKAQFTSPLEPAL